MPSTNELARAFNINPATAAKGVNRLVEEGLLYKRRGIGIVCCPPARWKLCAKNAAKPLPGHRSSRLCAKPSAWA